MTKQTRQHDKSNIFDNHLLEANIDRITRKIWKFVRSLMVYLLSFNTRTTINEVDDLEMRFIVTICIGTILIFHFFP